MFENLECHDKGKKNQEEDCILCSTESPCKRKANRPANQSAEDTERNYSRA